MCRGCSTHLLFTSRPFAARALPWVLPQSLRRRRTRDVTFNSAQGEVHELSSWIMLDCYPMNSMSTLAVQAGCVNECHVQHVKAH